MLNRIASSVFLCALLAGLSILGNCGKASAGYLLTSSSNPDSLIASENDGNELGAVGQTSSSSSTTVQSSENPLPSPDQPESPFAAHKLLNVYFGILNGRGSSSSGAGGPNNSNSSGGAGQPLAGSMIPLVSEHQGMRGAVSEPNAIPPTAMASRLFRPPRLS
jgi:hypothetical protein